MNAVRIRKPDWLRERDYRIAHRDTPDERWWVVVDGLARPGPLHFEAVTFITDDDFRFVGFDIEPAAAFVVCDFRINGETVPMSYPFSAVHMGPSAKRKSQFFHAGTSIMVQLRNDRREAVPFTVRMLEPRDLA